VKLADLEARGETCSVEEAALVLGVSRGVAYEAARCGGLPALRLGKRLVVPLSRLRALLDGEVTDGRTIDSAPAVLDSGCDPDADSR
jgi:excisionase family DNA binding protein